MRVGRRGPRRAARPLVGGLAGMVLAGCAGGGGAAPPATPPAPAPSLVTTDPSPVTITAVPTPPAEAPTDRVPTDRVPTDPAPTDRGRPDLPRLDTLAGPVPAGTYRHVLDTLGYGSDPPVLELTVPAGWSVLPVGSILRVEEDVTISFWNVAEVFADSCRWHGERQLVGPGIRDLALALQRVPGRSASEPVEVDVDGRWGLYLQWSVPPDLESDRPGSFVGCDDTRTGDTLYVSWTTWPDRRQRYHRLPGEVERLWILDVDGRRLVIDVQQEPSASPGAVAEADAIIASIRFVG